MCSLQVVSGCLRGTVSVWEVVTGRKTMEFAVSGGQHVEMTAMALDESERCLLTGLRDGTMKMWNYNIGKCLLTFPSPEQLEVSLACQLQPGTASWDAKHSSYDPGMHYFLYLSERVFIIVRWPGFKPP